MITNDADGLIKVNGYVDGLDGSCITGWAFSNKRPNCQIVIKDQYGQLLATGLACIERADLMSLGLGRSNIAFRIQLPPMPDVSRVHILADGQEITHSPLNVGVGFFDGHFSLYRGLIAGSVAERLADFAPPRITIMDQNDDVVFETQSTLRLLNDRTGSVRTAHFGGEIAQRCFGKGELLLTAYANGVKFAQIHSNIPLIGNIEELSPDRCTGWLVCPDAVNIPLTFEVYRDGKLETAVKCDLRRDDVQAVVSGALYCGFDITLPSKRSSTLAATTLSFKLPGSDRDLFEGPYVLAQRAALVRAARRVASAALRTEGQPLDSLERAVLTTAMTDSMARFREESRYITFKHQVGVPARMLPRLNVLIPIYRNVSVTKSCIDSVLRNRDPEQDRVILINDCSPDSGMSQLLWSYLDRPNIFLINNEKNVGFVKSCNKGLAFCSQGDVILLNSDTTVFAGGLEELWRAANSSPDIGTATALSNNATMFSYPHSELRRTQLHDITWSELAAVALETNRNKVIDIPTGHGFCLLIKQDVLRRVGKLDESFGRGYGEENDFCARAADLGYRNVLSPGCFVEHRESISFVDEKSGLISENLPKLEKRYPEYTPIIMEVLRCDDLRVARWAVDAERLRRSKNAYVLIVQHSLGGGTKQAVSDINDATNLKSADVINLLCREDGSLVVEVSSPLIQCAFQPNEIAELFDVISSANVSLCIVHQVIGFNADFIIALQKWMQARHSVFYAHDFYAICPRVTLIDALGQFCNVADADVCARCVEMGGSHPASRLTEFTPKQHRVLLGEFLGSFSRVIAPSQNASDYMRLAFPHIMIDVVPHPEAELEYKPVRGGNSQEIVLFGAIGPHKGSEKLVEIARLARMRSPSLSFHIIGYTDRDAELKRIGNVHITGGYKPELLEEKISNTLGRFALFLSGWPETFSYTLSEAVRFGFIPLVPDIGAPAERVRAAGFGAVFGFPIVAAEVLDLIRKLSNDDVAFSRDGAGPSSFSSGEYGRLRTSALLKLPSSDRVLESI